MDARSTPGTDAGASRLERELQEVEAAIALVRAGAAAVVSLTGLRFGEAILGRLRATGGDAGVALEPKWWPADEGCDIIVRAAHG
jgi:hypothetical protein